MTINWLLVACSIAVIGSAMSAGLFYTFSDFVVRSMFKARPPAGVEVMQNVNREIMGSGSIYLLLGNAALASLLAVLAFFTVTGPASVLMVAGGVLVFVGVLMVTQWFNVPMNIRLGRMAFESEPAAAYWNEYVPRWNWWNYVRAYASAAASVCFLIACLMLV